MVYTCLAKDRPPIYPKRSVVADEIDKLTEHGEATIFFFLESFLATSLCNIQLCRHFGISHLGLFDILVKKWNDSRKKITMSSTLSTKEQRHFTSACAGTYEFGQERTSTMMTATGSIKNMSTNISLVI